MKRDREIWLNERSRERERERERERRGGGDKETGITM